MLETYFSIWFYTWHSILSLFLFIFFFQSKTRSLSVSFCHHNTPQPAGSSAWAKKERKMRWSEIRTSEFLVQHVNKTLEFVCVSQLGCKRNSREKNGVKKILELFFPGKDQLSSNLWYFLWLQTHLNPKIRKIKKKA